MSMTLNDVLSSMRANSSFIYVGISLTIHSQAVSPAAVAQYQHNVYNGFGNLLYVPAVGGRAKRSEYLTTDTASHPLGISYVKLKVLNNQNYDTRPSAGTTDQQTFLVGPAVSELYGVNIDPHVLHVQGQPAPAARITFSPPSGRVHTPWSVDVIEDSGFLRGVGEDPVMPSAKALYSIAFGELFGDIT